MDLLPPFSSSRRGKVPFPFGRGHRGHRDALSSPFQVRPGGVSTLSGVLGGGSCRTVLFPSHGRGAGDGNDGDEQRRRFRCPARRGMASGQWAENGVTWTLGPPGLPADFKFQRPTDGRSEDPSTRTANPDKHEAWRNLPVETTTLFVESLGGRRPMKSRSSIPHGDSSCFAWLGVLP